MEEGLLKKGGSGGGWAAEMWEEGKRVGYLAGPMVAVTLSQYMVPVISTMMVGHISELALAGSSISTSLSSVTGFSVILGLASALETLCGQAYGAEQYQKLGIHMYRAIFFLVLVCIPITALWLNLERFLTLIGQEPAISHEAGKYTVGLIPALFAYAFLQPLMKFLQSQSLILPMLLSAVLTLGLHIPLCWILVFKAGKGITGASMAISITFCFNVTILGLYVRYSNSCKMTRAPLSKEIFRGHCELFRLALPSAVMTCLEWWSFELLVLLSGLLPNPELETSVLSICLTTISTLYAIPYGLGAAVSTRVSNELGGGNPHRARRAVRVAMFIATTEAAVVSVTIFFVRNIFGYAFSNEEEVIAYVRKIAPLISISVVVDGLQGVLSGISRGCGWQHLGAFVNLGAFYLFGIPIAAALGFWTNLRGEGLWIGILSGATVQTLLLALITLFTNWQSQAHLARERIFGERLTQDLLK